MVEERRGGKRELPDAESGDEFKSDGKINYKEQKYKKWRHMKRYFRRRRLRVLEHYGNKCVCCGETRPEFLTLDHVNNDGKSHREKIGKGGFIYLWAIKNHYPITLQILCWNCNMAKEIYGYCPHNKKLHLEPGQETLIIKSPKKEIIKTDNGGAIDDYLDGF